MKRSLPSNEQVDVISSDDSSSSDAEMEVTTEYDSKQLTSEGALMRRAEMYQEYMKHIPIPTHRGSVIPFTSWMGLGKSIKQLYGQPLHYLTNIQLKQWDQLRIGSEDEYRPLDAIIHPCKAEATIWLIEEVHRNTSSHHPIRGYQIQCTMPLLIPSFPSWTAARERAKGLYFVIFCLLIM